MSRKQRKASSYSKKPQSEKNNIPLIKPATDNQRRLLSYIDNEEYPCVIASGYAGTGKTFLTVGRAAEALAKNEIHKIMICRPIVSNGDEFGILKGDEKEKAEPWAQPALQVLRQKLTSGKVDGDLRQKTIEVKPLQMMQGYSLDKTWVICDEAQEMTVSQAKMLVTRLGVNSKLLLNGDVRQCNLDSQEDSGLKYLLDLCRIKRLPIGVVEMEMDDCQRSNFCRTMIEAIYS